MKSLNLHKCLLAGILLIGGKEMMAQTNRGYAITGETKGNIAWTVIREIDLTTGAEVRKIYSPADKPQILDALTGKRLIQQDINAEFKDQVTTFNRGIASTIVTYANGSKAEVVSAPSETMVAASAFDSKSNRLFFTPMHSSELRYFDFNRGINTVFYVRNTALKTFAETNGEADVITRMCFGADGYGYALTNDASHLIRFSSGEKITIVDLGAVQDGKNNKGISIRNLCTSWGGDMVADAFGNLYIISMKGNIFKLNPQTLVADHIGAVKNIPQDYLINGAAVDAKGNIIVTCATKTDHYYSINIATWEAVVLPQQQSQLYNASDLASCHLAYEDLAGTKPAAAKSVISLYPNPVTNRVVNISFDGLSGNTHTVQVVDGAGNSILSKVVNTNGKTNSQLILPRSISAGVYIVKIMDGTGKEQYSGKVVVQ